MTTKTNHLTAQVTWTFILLLMTTLAVAAMPVFENDGWHSWQVQSVPDAPDWCCVEWHNDTATSRACDLDSRQHNYMAGDEATKGSGTLKIYAKLKNGELRALRALSASCAVSADSRIIEHGEVDTNDSVAWLAKRIQPRSDVSTYALAAVAVHAGKAARRTLVATAKEDPDFRNRKDAVFWMGQARAGDTLEEIKALMYRDPNSAMREHAAFSLSQTDLPERAVALDKLGRTDSDPDVRGKAWFWLAQTGLPEAEAMIGAALARETHRKSREAVIFALSQLPDGTGVDALISVIEDRELSDADRKHALFWLAQSDSERAYNYLARVLD